MPKVLFVANVAKEHINKFHIPTIKAFRQRGWIVDVACAGDADVPYCSHQFRMGWKRSPFSLRTFTGIVDLKRIIDRGNYDVIYCHTPVGGLIARLAAVSARKKGTKVIYTAHGFHFFEGAPLINWLVYYPIEWILAWFTDVIFTVNLEDYKRAQEKFGHNTKIKLVPEVGVVFDRLEVADKAYIRKKYRQMLNIPDKATVLIYVAELIKNKNQTMLIDALELLHKKVPEACLLLVGPDHWNGYVQKYAAEKQLSSSVICTGWRDDIANLIVASDICVASSIREGFGINIVEAMYLGLPVVATSNRGHQMVIKDRKNGFLVKTGDYRTMAKRIFTLIAKPDLRKRMSYNDVSRFDADIIADILVDTITEIVYPAKNGSKNRYTKPAMHKTEE